MDAVLTQPEGARVQVLAPLIKDRKGHHHQVFEDVRKAGFVRVRVDSFLRDVDEGFELDRYKMHTIEAVVDRLVIKQSGQDRGRLNDSIEQALKLGNGSVIVNKLGVSANEPGEDLLFSERFACAFCDISLPEIEPRTFSFNSPHGACPACIGLGTTLEIDPELVIPNKELSISEGAIQPFARMSTTQSWYAKLLEALRRKAESG